LIFQQKDTNSVKLFLSVEMQKERGGGGERDRRDNKEGESRRSALCG